MAVGNAAISLDAAQAASSNLSFSRRSGADFDQQFLRRMGSILGVQVLKCCEIIICNFFGMNNIAF